MSSSSVLIEDTLSSTDENLKSAMLNIFSRNLKDENTDRLIVSKTNTLLSSETTRQRGLSQINLILDNNAIHPTTESALFWLNHCMIKYSNDNLRELKFNTIRKIVQNMHTEQEFTKRFLSEYMTKILETCLVTTHINSFACEAALQILSTCMKCFGSWFCFHKGKIEGFLLQFLDNENKNLVNEAALAFHYLQQAGGAGTDGLNHRNSFSRSFHKLCGTVHKLLDEFLKNEHEIGNYNRSSEEYYEFKVASVDSYKLKEVFYKRLENCIIFLETMIRTGFPVSKDIKPKRLLDIIIRATSVHHCLSNNNNHSIESYGFSLILTKIQVKFMRLLRWVIIWYNTNILPFSYVINKLLLDCLKRTQNCDCFYTELVYKEVVHKTLSEWIRISTNSMHSNFQNQLVTCILKNITPVKSQLTLTISNNDSKNLSKKARKKAMNNKIIASGKNNTETQISSQHDNMKIDCNLSLQTLKSFLTNVAVKIDTQYIQQIYSVVLSCLVDIQSGHIHQPYQDSHCQIGLYEVLVSFYEQNTIKIHPPLQLSLQILNNGTTSDNRFISNVCEKGLFALEKFCQPVCPSLYLNTRSVDENEAGEQVALNADFILNREADAVSQPLESNEIVDEDEDEVSPDYLSEEQHKKNIDEDSRHSLEIDVEFIENNSNDNMPQNTDSQSHNDPANGFSTNGNNAEDENLATPRVSVNVNIEETPQQNGISTIDDVNVDIDEPPEKRTKLDSLEQTNKITDDDDLVEVIDLEGDFVDEVKEY